VLTPPPRPRPVTATELLPSWERVFVAGISSPWDVPGDGRYERRYSRAALAAWRKSIQVWQQSDCNVYYFDNDQKSAAPMDALALLRLLAR
jgi:uncharacterized protein YecE (DUF72 family)